MNQIRETGRFIQDYLLMGWMSGKKATLLLEEKSTVQSNSQSRKMSFEGDYQTKKNDPRRGNVS